MINHPTQPFKICSKKWENTMKNTVIYTLSAQKNQLKKVNTFFSKLFRWVPQAKADSRWNCERHRRNFHIYIVQHLHQPKKSWRFGWGLPENSEEFDEPFVWGKKRGGNHGMKNVGTQWKSSFEMKTSLKCSLFKNSVQCSLYGWVIFQKKTIPQRQPMTTLTLTKATVFKASL